ncbi:MAG: HEPN domain-containing protein [Desulfobacteraceae bacterium]|nr:MAG: HEPN domain-containing protein [Desulfobacteraceae bacterium]
MTNDSLARSYLIKATKRLKILPVLLDEDAFSDVIREAQEIVELALKGMLRQVGIEPPKWHDVGPHLKEFQERFEEPVRAHIQRLAAVSKWLRKEREFSFYGDIDFIPTEEYSREDALRAMEDAVFVVGVAEQTIEK